MQIKEKRLCTCTVLELLLRGIVGWAMDDNDQEQEDVVAVLMVIALRHIA